MIIGDLQLVNNYTERSPTLLFTDYIDEYEALHIYLSCIYSNRQEN